MAPKGKGAKQGAKLKDSDHTPHHSELLQLIELGELPLENKLQLLHCAQPACPPGCKGGRKDNPACLCGLIPEEGRFKKAGLFQKTPTALGELGIDPTTQRRAVRLRDALRAAPCSWAAAAGAAALRRCRARHPCCRACKPLRHPRRLQSSARRN